MERLLSPMKRQRAHTVDAIHAVFRGEMRFLAMKNMISPVAYAQPTKAKNQRLFIHSQKETEDGNCKKSTG